MNVISWVDLFEVDGHRREEGALLKDPRMEWVVGDAEVHGGGGGHWRDPLGDGQEVTWRGPQ